MHNNLRDRLAQLLSDGPLVRVVQSAPGIAVGSVMGPARAENQDRAIVARITRGDNVSTSFIVAAICDGMGGMLEGGEAAALAASTFIAELALSSERLRDCLHDAITKANIAVYERYRGKGGTTLTAIALDDNQNGFAVHVGDSRLYRRLMSELTLMTTDDTVQGVVQARSFRSDEDRLDSQLIQFVGIGAEMEPHIFPISDRDMFLEPDKAWLLTTDGAHGLGKQMLQGINNNASSAAEYIRKLMFVADAAGLSDNATAIAIFPKELSKLKLFHAGITLSVWTPVNSLELWIDSNGPPISQENLHPRKDAKQKTRHGSPKNKNQKNAKRNNENLSRSSENKKKDTSVPQLDITFGNDRRRDD